VRSTTSKSAARPVLSGERLLSRALLSSFVETRFLINQNGHICQYSLSTTLFKSNKPAIYDPTMSLEDDVYNDIFTALKHPIRRKILKSLENNPHTYTELLNELELETGLLNYHLENLKTLIRKDEGGKYAISIFGRAALSARYQQAPERIYG